MMKPTVFIPRSIASEGVEYLHAHGFDTREGSSMEEEVMCREVRGCEAILVRTARITRAVMEAEPALKIIARHGTGLDIIDMAAAAERGIQVVNTPQSNGQSVAEMTICGMIAVSRKVQQLSLHLKAGDFFFKNRCNGTEIAGKTLGLIGFGNIGAKVAHMAAFGFGMKVLVYRGHMENKPVPEYVQLADWDQIFSASDYVSLHIPMRPENTGIVGKREFSMMKPTAVFVNTARGKLIEETELAAALERNALAGAYLDVLGEEPFAADHPLLQFEQVLVTPHSGSNTKEALVRSAVDAAAEIDRFFRGEPVQWPANRIPEK